MLIGKKILHLLERRPNFVNLLGSIIIAELSKKFRNLGICCRYFVRNVCGDVCEVCFTWLQFHSSGEEIYFKPSHNSSTPRLGNNSRVRIHLARECLWQPVPAPLPIYVYAGFLESVHH